MRTRKENRGGGDEEKPPENHCKKETGKGTYKEKAEETGNDHESPLSLNDLRLESQSEHSETNQEKNSEEVKDKCHVDQHQSYERAITERVTMKEGVKA